MKQFFLAVYTAMIESRKQQADRYIKHYIIGWY
jgi:hypothetical protein